MFNEQNNILYVDNTPLSALAEKYGTPLYVYSANEIRSQYTRLRDTMVRILPENRQPMLCYACKANDHLAVLSYIRALGSCIEIVSEGELYRALKAGFKPEQIVATGVGKTVSEITALIKAGIHQINVESLEELERINDIAQSLSRNVNTVLRFNPDVSGGGHDKISTGRKGDKFGLNEAQVYEGFNRATNMDNVNLCGLSMHIGSQVFEVSAFEKAFAKLPALVESLRDQGHTVTRLDIGGGFPIKYNDENLLDLDAYAQWVNDIIVPLGTEIIMEPGRYLVGNAAVLLAEAEYIKKTEDTAFLILNTGMNDLIRPAMYDAYHAIEPIEGRNASPRQYDIVGPICESSDKFGAQRSISEVKQGDILAIRSAGAYGSCMSNNYNTRRKPAVVFVNGDQYTLISARETYDDLLNKEIVPDWIS